jgi:hypothetical protein
LKRWWEERELRKNFRDAFNLRRSFNPAGDSYGFFDVADIGGTEIPVMGMVQDMMFDTSNGGRPEWIRDQLRQFVLSYLMRVSSFRQPDVYADAKACVPSGPEHIGFGYSQLYYKRLGSEPGAFPEDLRYRILDLRNIASQYDWLVMHVKLYSFNLRFSPLGTDEPNLILPLSESTFLVVSRDFVVDETEDREGSIGRYGFGYAVLKSPESSFLAYGPGQFDVGFQNFVFTVLPDGASHVRMAFVVNRANRIVNLPLDPVFAFIDAANLLTGGLAARYYCISRRALETIFLMQHYKQHYEMIVGALSTWCQIDDWLDEKKLPHWVLSGRVQ